MIIDAKPDKEYDTRISLEDNRQLPNGHTFHHAGEHSDVEVIDKILSGWFNDENIETISEFSDYKMDFALTYIDTMIIIMNEKMNTTRKYFEEIEHQSEAISHRIIKPFLSGKPINKEEKLEIYDLQENILVKRRKLKDTLSIMGVFIENMEKTRNFILSMNTRYYTPKSDKFKNDEKYNIPPVRSTSGYVKATLNKISK